MTENIKYHLEFILTGLPARTNNTKSHWAAKMKEVKQWQSRIFWICKKNGLPKKPLKKAHLTLIRMSSACPDADGLVSSFKHVIDGLIYAKVLENDKMSNIGMPTYHWEKAPRGQGSIKVIVEEIIG